MAILELINSVVGDRPLNGLRVLVVTLQQEPPLSPSNSTEQLPASANSAEEEAAEANGATPLLQSNCRLKLLPQRFQSSMNLLSSNSRRKARRQK